MPFDANCVPLRADGNVEQLKAPPRRYFDWFDAKTLAELTTDLEAHETPVWAPVRILEVELLTRLVWDPCCGTGVMAEAARRAGHEVIASDVFDWGYRRAAGFCGRWFDFLGMPAADPGADFTVFMNPPFSQACEFVLQAKRLGARKIVSFQRAGWFESEDRADFWDAHPPTRIWTCGSRATCWRFDLTEAEGARRSTPTAHAFYVWERGHRGGPQHGRIYRKRAAEWG